jgi:hypothetical protein
MMAELTSDNDDGERKPVMSGPHGESQ